MNIFRLFQSKKFYENMLHNASNCTIQKKILREVCPRITPYQTLDYTTRRKPPPQKKKKLASLIVKS